MAGQKRQFLRRAFGRNNEANTASDESNTLHSQAPEPPNVDAKNPSTASLCLKTTSTVRAFPTEPQQLWDEAYESLKHDQPALLEGYEKILARELEVEIIEQNDSHTRRSQMRKIVQRGLDKTEKETRIKQNLGQAMRIPLAVNDIMQLALKQCPEAALAWSAISLSLQIFSNPMNEAEANRNGLKYIYDNMNWYWELSSHLIKESDPDATPYKVLRWELKERIVDLYKDLLSYQIMSVCSYYRNRVFVFLRDIVQLDDWDGSLVNVKNTEAVVREKYQVYWGQQSLDHQKAGTGLLQEISKGVLAQALQQRDIQEEKDDKECLKSLYLTDPAADMEQIQESREFLIPRSCDWIVKHPCFTDWRDFKTIRLLWIKGGPGKGKTMILMTIIKHLSQSLHDNNIPSFFFCQETVKDANARVLRGLIYQILVQNRALISYLRKVYDLQGSKLFESKNTFTALKDIFVEMINDPKLDRVFLVVDALDECQPDDLKPLLSLINACVSNSPQVKWLVSSRHVGEVERQLQRTEYRTELDLDKDVGGLVQGGIEVYINHKLSDLFECFSEIYGDAEPYVTGELQRVEKEFAAEVQKKADGTFLWIALVFRQIKESECDADNVLDFVRQMPPTLKGMYDRMMDQIVNSEGSMFEPCQQALLVAINVYRPLQLCEMIKLAGFKVLSVPNHIIMRCGLLSIRESDQTVSFIHQSAKDYLMDKESKFHSTLFPNGHLDGHRTIVNRSLGAMDLFHKDIEGLRDPAFQLMDDYKPQSGLLNSTAYSCVYWIDHLCEAKSDLTAVDNHRKMDTRDENIMVFLEKHFLHWLEALSLLKSIPKGVVAIMKLLSLLERRPSNADLLDFVRDSNRFLPLQQGVIADYPLQTYSSALIFSPTLSVIRERFKSEEPAWIISKPTMEEEWGDCIQTSTGHYEAVYAVAFSPDGERIVSGSTDKTVRIWDANNGACLIRLGGHTMGVFSVAFSPNGNHVISGSTDSTIKIWDAKTGICLRTLNVDSRGNLCIALSPCGNYIVSGSQNSTIEIWEFSSGICLDKLYGCGDRVYSVAFSPSGEYFALGDGSPSVRIWDFKGRTCTKKLHGHADTVESVAFCPRNEILASGSYDCTIKIWDISSGICQKTLPGDDSPIRSLVFSPDGNSNREKRLDKHDKHDNRVTSVAFSPDGGSFASGSYDRTVKIWDTNSGVSLQTLSHYTYVQSLIFSNNGKYIASGAKSGVYIWDTSTGICLHTLSQEGPINSVIFSHDSRYLASGGGLHPVKIWDVRSGDCIHELYTDHLVGTITFSPGDRHVIVLLNTILIEPRIVQIWDIGTRTNMNTVRLGFCDDWTRLFAFSPNGKYLVSGSKDNSVKVWDASSSTCLHTLFGHEDRVKCVAMSPISGDNRVISRSADRTIKIWDAVSGDCLATLRSHNYEIQLVEFLSDARHALSMSRNKTVEIWDTASGTCVETFQDQNPSFLSLQDIFGNGIKYGDIPVTTFQVNSSTDLYRYSSRPKVCG